MNIKIDYNLHDRKFEIYVNEIAKSQERAITFDTTLKYFRNVKGKRVVDFGCGPGYFLKICKDLGARSVTGIDLSPAMIETDKETFGTDRQVETDLFVYDCFQDLPEYYKDKYDFANSHFVLHNANNIVQCKTFLSNMFSVLKSGGKCVISIPNTNYNEEERLLIAKTLGILWPSSDIMAQLDESQLYRTSYLKWNNDSDEYSLTDAHFTWDLFKWSKETIVTTMIGVGFVDVEQLDPVLSSFATKDNVKTAAGCFVIILCARKPGLSVLHQDK